MPESGRVREVEAVAVRVIGNAPRVENELANETFCPAVKLSDSPPAKLMELVLSVVVSLTVNVSPAPKVKVPLPVEITLPLKVAACKIEVWILLALMPKAVTFPVVPETAKSAEPVELPPIIRSFDV